MQKKESLTKKIAVSVLVSSAVIYLAIFGYAYFLSRQIVLGGIEGSAKLLAKNVAGRIETIFRSVERIPETVATSMREAPFFPDRIERALFTIVKSNPDIYGSAVALEPFAFDPALEYYAPYAYKEKNEVKFISLATKDYDYPNQGWYSEAKKAKASIWTEPYFDEGGGEIMMATYSVPIFQEESSFSGVITADISLNWLEEIINGLTLKYDGHELIQDASLYSLKTGLITRLKTRYIEDDSDREKLLQLLGESETAFGPLEGTPYWFTFVTLENPEWKFILVLNEGVLTKELNELGRNILLLGFLGFGVLLWIIIHLSKTITRPLRELATSTVSIGKGDFDFSLPDIKSNDEIHELSDSFKTMQTALKEYVAQLGQTVKAKERIESELRIGSEIQRNMLPSILPEHPGFEISTHLSSAKQVSGDFYDYFSIDPDHFCFVIGDVSGKGVPAALFMAMAITLIRATANHFSSPEAILSQVNTELEKNNEACMFITAFCGVLDLKTGALSYVNAGHTDTLYLKGGKSARFLPSKEKRVLGIQPNIHYKNETLQLGKEDSLCVYTDGITEAFDKNQTLFGEDRLLKTVNACSAANPKELISGLLQEMNHFAEGAPQSDDITLVALKYKG